MPVNSVFTIRLGLIVSLLSLTGQAANSSASPTLATGMTVATTGTISVWSTPSTGNKSIGEEAQGNQGTVIGGPESADSITWWEVSFNDDLTGWTTQSGLEAASSRAPTLSFSASPASIAPGGLSTLSWSSSNALGLHRIGLRCRWARQDQYSVTPSATTTYSINCTNGFGSTSRSTSLNVKPFPSMSWTQSLPVTFNNPALVPFGGTEARSLVFMDGSLYAGIGDWEDPELANSQTPGAQVLRLNSPTSGWVKDKDFNEVVPSTGKKDYQVISILGTAHFDRNSGNESITPVDVLMAGFWNLARTDWFYGKNRHDRCCRSTGNVYNELVPAAAEQGRPSPLLHVLHIPSLTWRWRSPAPSPTASSRSSSFGQQKHRMGRNRGSGQCPSTRQAAIA